LNNTDNALIIQTQQQIQKEMIEHQSKHQKTGISTPVYRIVLTGGPCGGKSSAMAAISDRLMSLGFRVFRVPEAATLLLTGTGLNPAKMDEQERTTFEGSMVKTKIALEDIFYQIAKASNHPSVIICDRGTMDTRAYMDDENWEVMLDEHGWNVVDLRDRRYDAVIHMVTAAIGAEKYYTTENNAARSENLNEARELDDKVLKAWVGHPKIRIIDNSTDFKNKIRRVEDVICQIVGAPRPTTIERKFIVSDEIAPDIAEKIGIRFETFYVEQTYLQKGTQSLPGYNYLRRRGQNGMYTYTHSILRHPSMEHGEDTSSAILERAISGREYVALLKATDPKRSVIVKKVQCFLWNNIYYELQTYVKPYIGLTILKTEVETGKSFTYPWFLNVKGEITGLPQFSSYYLSEVYSHMNNPKQQGISWKKNQEMMEAYMTSKELLREKKKKKEHDLEKQREEMERQNEKT